MWSRTLVPYVKPATVGYGFHLRFASTLAVIVLVMINLEEDFDLIYLIYTHVLNRLKDRHFVAVS